MQLSNLNKFFKIIFLSLCLWLGLRIFIFQAFIVPTASMNNTFMEGDVVFTNKLAFGARLPITPLSLHIGNRKLFIDWITIPYFRLPGYATIKHDDIVIFNSPSETDLPIDEKRESIKRCVGLPGDVISIIEADVVINNVFKKESNVLKWFELKIKSGINDSLYMNKFCHKFDVIEKNDIYTFITTSTADSLIKCKEVVSLIKKHFSKEDYLPNYFPHAPQIKWNPDNFGPFYIPKKGEGIYLNRRNLQLYENLLETYENNRLHFKGDSVFINNKFTDFYIFKLDYYFVLGDNRYNSIDSRYWGLVPEDHLIGKAK